MSHPHALQGLGSPIALERGPLITCQGTDQQLPSFRGQEGVGWGPLESVLIPTFTHAHFSVPSFSLLFCPLRPQMPEPLWVHGVNISPVLATSSPPSAATHPSASHLPHFVGISCRLLSSLCPSGFRDTVLEVGAWVQPAILKWDLFCFVDEGCTLPRTTIAVSGKDSIHGK